MGTQGSPVKSYDYLLKFLLVGDSDVGKGEILASLQDGAAESPYGHPAGERRAGKEWGWSVRGLGRRGAQARELGGGGLQGRRGDGVESAGAAKSGSWPGEGRQRAEQKRPGRYGVPKGSAPRAEGAGRSRRGAGGAEPGRESEAAEARRGGVERAGTVKERGLGTRKGSAGLRAVESLPESRSHDAGSPGCTPRTLDMGDPGD